MNYAVQASGIIATGISIGSASWIVIDGGNWDGSTIHGTGEKTGYLAARSSNDTLRNLETYDNGAIQPSGMNITITRSYSDMQKHWAMKLILQQEGMHLENARRTASTRGQNEKLMQYLLGWVNPRACTGQ